MKFLLIYGYLLSIYSCLLHFMKTRSMLLVQQSCEGRSGQSTPMDEGRTLTFRKFFTLTGILMHTTASKYPGLIKDNYSLHPVTNISNISIPFIINSVIELIPFQNNYTTLVLFFCCFLTALYYCTQIGIDTEVFKYLLLSFKAPLFPLSPRA